MLSEVSTPTRVRLVRGLDELRALEPEWRELWMRDPRATPFQLPAWLIPWTNHFTNGELACAVVWRGGQLIGLLPAFTWHDPKINQRELVLLGTGVSDYNDGIFDPAFAGEAIAAALDCVAREADWDVLNFEELRPDSPLAAIDGDREPQSVCPVLGLPTRELTLRSVVPASMWQNLNTCRNRARRFGAVEFQIAGEATLDEFLDEVFAMHAARWRDKNQPSLLRDENVRAFDRDAARRLLTIGALRLFRVQCGGRTIAALYCFASGARFYCYLTAFDPEFAAMSPGTLVLGHAIEQALRERRAVFEFLRGTERYKYLWGAKDTRTFRVKAAREQLRAARVDERDAG